MKAPFGHCFEPGAMKGPRCVSGNAQTTALGYRFQTTELPELAGGRLSVTDKLYIHVHLTLRAGDKATYFLNVGADFGICLQARRVLQF